MALLRQCLREVRIKHREWEPDAGAWLEMAPARREVAPVERRTGRPDAPRTPRRDDRHAPVAE